MTNDTHEMLHFIKRCIELDVMRRARLTELRDVSPLRVNAVPGL